ncbi:MAG: class I SAM-dependent methyltransferase [Gammaproteobacteria bacterium]|nr:class I SAM-dependent methyltransferase [Gammaproteobacteria bacterium]
MNSSLQDVYNQFANTYEQNRGQFDMTEVLESFLSQFKGTPGKLLDLGCGAGEPLARFFIDNGWSVTGVDFSEQMLELAKKYVPEMSSIHSDIRQVDFADGEFAAITASYSLFHIPASDHGVMFNKFFRWLQPGGKALFTYATSEYTGKEEFEGYKEFMDQQLFYSHKNIEDLNDDLSRAGFYINAKDYRTIGGETFLWLTVSRPQE